MGVLAPALQLDWYDVNVSETLPPEAYASMSLIEEVVHNDLVEIFGEREIPWSTVDIHM
jgi:hypothetical protein